MALSNEERERIREEEWVRLQAREDFYKSNPEMGPGGSFGALRWRGRRQMHPGFFLATVALLGMIVVIADIAERVNWNHILP